ncbi:MAG: aminotransferase class I/II-fold pyridoxal phosphate-dependent enzyme [Deltaproteobacteria bacterium]|nr:aminotransferase class I/II-fold pyridoxal phosphate-dependent enzyme [Deltaproteobacteria bacterium]
MVNFNAIDEQLLRKRAALKWGPWGEDVISLSVADIDFQIPREIKDGVMRALEEDRTLYSSYGGDPDVLEVVCEKLNCVNGTPATSDDVHMVPGTMFAIFLACYYTLVAGNEALICPAPVYPPFMENIHNAHGIPVYSPLDFHHGLKVDLDDLERRITPRTRLLMVCNPHNPSGRVLTREELEAICRIAQQHDLFIFSDELYEDMVFEGEHVSIASLDTDLFERTLTAFGMTSHEMKHYLEQKAKVIVENGAEFGPHGEGHVRINFATAYLVLKEAMDRIEKALIALKRGASHGTGQGRHRTSHHPSW